jgi:glycosyltransferase involved in cell wall biosynthesis
MHNPATNNNKGRVAVIVSNDLNHDQRVLKISTTLEGLGWTPQLIGREMPGSRSLDIPFAGSRLVLPFSKGFLFYAAWQWKLLFALLRSPNEAIWANDLDTLLPAYLACKWQGIPLVYDSHEFFTEAAGLTGRPLQRGVWLVVEKWIFPRLKSVITVNNSIAEAYARRYPKSEGGKPLVVRNMPMKRTEPIADVNWREELGIPEESIFLILQGAYLDIDRGVVEAIEAMRLQSNWHLVVVGAGAEFEWAKTQITSLKGRLICLPKMPFEELCTLTASADIGLSLDRGVHVNYWFSLPNKLFDYVHAGIPVVASPMPEVKRIVEDWHVGAVIEDHSPDSIAAAVRTVMSVDKSRWEGACREASFALNWQAESDVIAQAMVASGALIQA